jgi:two-component system LytT family response regulator
MDKNFTAIIVDDEPLARKGLAIRLRDFKQLNLVAQCGNGREAIDTICQLQPDLVFLDIQMPGINGFGVIQELQRRQQRLPLIVFVTAFDNYAIKAFEIHALDYLLKPVDDQRLALTIAKVIEALEQHQDSQHKERLLQLVSQVSGNDCEDILRQLASNAPVPMSQYSDILPVKDGGEVTRVPVDNIIWIDAAGDYMCVHTDTGTHILRKTMKQLEAVLDPKKFIRTHRSIIVNKKAITKLANQVNGEY